MFCAHSKEIYKNKSCCTCGHGATGKNDSCSSCWASFIDEQLQSSVIGISVNRQQKVGLLYTFEIYLNKLVSEILDLIVPFWEKEV